MSRSEFLLRLALAEHEGWKSGKQKLSGLVRGYREEFRAGQCIPLYLDCSVSL